MKLPTPEEHRALKEQAYLMKMRTGMKISQCYEEIAKQKGFRTYAAMREAMKEKNK